ncbi:MAG: hypothetical protein KGY50_04805 [Candidatus Thermoplasmatota archaeon]|nr:hypothetical protein [Candidatus Thermoplasmatota archaeon]
MKNTAYTDCKKYVELTDGSIIIELKNYELIGEDYATTGSYKITYEISLGDFTGEKTYIGHVSTSNRPTISGLGRNRCHKGRTYLNLKPRLSC